jgi:hypothetical protein
LAENEINKIVSFSGEFGSSEAVSGNSSASSSSDSKYNRMLVLGNRMEQLEGKNRERFLEEV